MKKKNRTWRAAALLLALTLVTSCFVGGTFAKYTTTGEATDTARVAKFGVTVEAGGSLFGKSYIAVGDGGNGNTPGTDASLTVKSSSEDNVLAPGTKSSAEGLTINVTGTPEVDVKVTSELKVRNVFLKAGQYAKMVKINNADYVADKYYKIGDDGVFKKATDTAAIDGTAYYELQKTYGDIAFADYYPVQYKYGGEGTADISKDSLTDTTTGIVKKIIADIDSTATVTDTTNEDGGKVYKFSTKKEANTVLDTEFADLNSKYITWEWKFDDDTTAGKYDKEDTLLGDLMAYNTADGATNDYEIVAVTGTVGSETYTKLIFDGDNKLVKNGSDIVASLKTEFNLKITVEQVD